MVETHHLAARAATPGRAGREPRRRPAFTLVELLVATTASLLLILALAQGFAVVSQTVTLNRATIEMAGQLRGVTLRLRKDLDGITSPVIPSLPSSANRGYVELHDGPSNDSDADGNGTADLTQGWDTSLGDIDDVLMFTTRSVDEPFEGRVLGVPMQSIDAEVAWWTVLNDTNADGFQSIGERYTLYRRALLIRPDLNGTSGFVTRLTNPVTGNFDFTMNSQQHMQALFQAIRTFTSENDLSVRFVRAESGNNVQVFVVANSLADLALRQNRFAHDNLVTVDLTATPPTYAYRPSPVAPYDFVAGFNGAVLASYIRSGNQLGDDVMTINVLAFDLRVFDPLAPISIHPGEDGAWGAAGVDDDQGGGADDIGEYGWPRTDDLAVTPGDLGFGAALSGTPPTLVVVGNGAYVDLNYFGKYGYSTPTYPWSQFALTGGAAFNMPSTACVHLAGPIFDTWALDYENNQWDENSNNVADEGMDGLDGNGTRGVDDITERETWPPYGFELRSLQVRVRIIEPDTRQVRQATVTADFASD